MKNKNISIGQKSPYRSSST